MVLVAGKTFLTYKSYIKKCDVIRFWELKTQINKMFMDPFKKMKKLI